MQRAPDDVVDSVEVVAGERFDLQGRVTGEAAAGSPGAPPGSAGDALAVLVAFVTNQRADAEFLIDGAEQGLSRGTDGGSFALSDVTGEPGVVIEVAPGHAVVVSEEAFHRLIGRMRQVLAGGPGGS